MSTLHILSVWKLVVKPLLTAKLVCFKWIGKTRKPVYCGGRLDSSSVLYGFGCHGVQTHTGIVYQFGPFEVNATSGELLKNGRRIRPQELPHRLLVALLETLERYSKPPLA
ncbi:MAG: hypothetical protein QOE55_164 [Acidobacteriaceae bacterium]|jgi:hypothetical protein|nr:hypothetical protein [Acidobacteriaceae bacterium]